MGGSGEVGGLRIFFETICMGVDENFGPGWVKMPPIGVERQAGAQKCPGTSPRVGKKKLVSNDNL